MASVAASALCRRRKSFSIVSLKVCVPIDILFTCIMLSEVSSFMYSSVRSSGLASIVISATFDRSMLFASSV